MLSNCLLKVCSAAILVFVIVTGFRAVPAQATFNKEEFAARRAKVLEKLGNNYALILANQEHPHSVKYREAPDFYYLTGVEEPGAMLVLSGRRKAAYILATKKPEWKIPIEGPGIRDVKDAARIYGLNGVLPVEDVYMMLAQTAVGGAKLYMQLSPSDQLQYARSEMAVNEAGEMQLPFAQMPRGRHLVAAIRNWQPNLELADVSPIIDELRWVKTPFEIERMRMAGKIGAEGVKEAIKGTKPGMYEYELEAAARYVYVKRGARGDAFLPIVPSGPNSVILHYSKNDRRMQAGEIVYMDYGADYDYYTSDITRTWPVSGRFSPEQEKMYRCILEARSAIIAAIKPGATVEDLEVAAAAIYKKHGFEAEFAKTNRYVGHYIGMSVHDVGSDAKPFVPGVVFNVEPLLQNDALKTHVRLEDTVLVTANGAENLTEGVPAEINEIYSLMKQRPITLSN
jgi:Xaa-Pro aminopeptidase